ncbi:MAG: nitronate monooxygenase, partial [Flavobacteriales bacterium 32-34-25]
ESSAHENFKQAILNTKEGETQLTLKELTPVRLIKNKFFEDIQELYNQCATKEDLAKLLGKARAKKGIFEGDLIEGELEIGQVSGLIHEIKSAASIVSELIKEYELAKASVAQFL